MSAGPNAEVPDVPFCAIRGGADVKRRPRFSTRLSPGALRRRVLESRARDDKGVNANRRGAGFAQERAALSRTLQDFLSAATRLVVLPLRFANIEPYLKEKTYG